METTVRRACDIQDCDRPYYSTGWCKYHYNRNCVHGSPTYIRPVRKCAGAGCTVQIPQRSDSPVLPLCTKHAARLKHHGDPNFVNPKCNRDGKAKERNRARTAKWKKDNWPSYKAYLATRKTRVKQVTPPWADLAAIRAFYAACPPGYHVDHIFPVNGKTVTGLHVLDNLQYLPAVENLRKGNKLPKGL